MLFELADCVFKAFGWLDDIVGIPEVGVGELGRLLREDVGRLEHVGTGDGLDIGPEVCDYEFIHSGIGGCDEAFFPVAVELYLRTEIRHAVPASAAAVIDGKGHLLWSKTQPQRLLYKDKAGGRGLVRHVKGEFGPGEGHGLHVYVEGARSTGRNPFSLPGAVQRRTGDGRRYMP